MKKVCSAADFTATEFSTSEDKAWFANYFVYFVESDFSRSLFTQRFYTRLSICFGHIAHYNQHGFYDEWFSSTNRKADFLRHTLQAQAHGLPEFTYCDVERAIRRYLRGSSLLETYAIQARVETETRERALLGRLRAKYEPSAPVMSTPARPLTGSQISLFGAEPIVSNEQGNTPC